MIRHVLMLLAFVACMAPLGAQQRERATVPEKYKWDLAPIYPSVAAWRAAKDQLEEQLLGLRKFKGTLGQSPAALADALERVTALQKTFSRVAVYAGLLADEDTRQAEHQGMRQEVTLLGASFGTEMQLPPEH